MKTINHFCLGLSAMLVVATVVQSASAQTKDWQNPELTGVNNLAPHATMIICPDVTTALKIGPALNALL